MTIIERTRPVTASARYQCMWNGACYATIKPLPEDGSRAEQARRAISEYRTAVSARSR